VSNRCGGGGTRPDGGGGGTGRMRPGEGERLTLVIACLGAFRPINDVISVNEKGFQEKLH